MKSDIGPFLREGIKSYAEACFTIETFEREMISTLRSALDSLPDWTPLADANIGRIKAGGSADNFWIETTVTGTSILHGPVELNLGLWWNAPDIPDPIVFASFYRKPEALLSFRWPTAKDGIGSFLWSRRTILHLPVVDAGDIEPGLHKMLSALLGQLSDQEGQGGSRGPMAEASPS
jgi:hypothetical protein